MDAVRSLRSVERRSPAVTRAVALVEELARQRRPLGIAELAWSLDLAKSPVANLRTGLEGANVIRRVGGRWALGYKAVELGQAFLVGTDRVQEFRWAASGLPARRCSAWTSCTPTSTRQRGCAVDDEQNTEGVVCVSVALSGTEIPTAVSATLLAARTTDQQRTGLWGI